jgi:PHD/YefM family antitoxin component YafN of YafNO toxin-antitoxin module
VAIVTKHDETVAYLVSAEKWESMLETMELLANPEFQHQRKLMRQGDVEYFDVETLPD